MTLLTKPIRRELPLTIDRRQWIVEMHGAFIRFRAKRSRRTFDIPWESVWLRAMWIAAAARKGARRG